MAYHWHTSAFSNLKSSSQQYLKIYCTQDRLTKQVPLSGIARALSCQGFWYYYTEIYLFDITYGSMNWRKCANGRDNLPMGEQLRLVPSYFNYQAQLVRVFTLLASRLQELASIFFQLQILSITGWHPNRNMPKDILYLIDYSLS